jgi:hypothetical protein
LPCTVHLGLFREYIPLINRGSRRCNVCKSLESPNYSCYLHQERSPRYSYGVLLVESPKSPPNYSSQESMNSTSNFELGQSILIWECSAFFFQQFHYQVYPRCHFPLLLLTQCTHVQESGNPFLRSLKCYICERRD